MLTYEEDLTPDEGTALDGLLFLIQILAYGADYDRNNQLDSRELGSQHYRRFYSSSGTDLVRQVRERPSVEPVTQDVPP